MAIDWRTQKPVPVDKVPVAKTAYAGVLGQEFQLTNGLWLRNGHLRGDGGTPPTLGTLQAGINDQAIVAGSNDIRGAVLFHTTFAPPAAFANLVQVNFARTFAPSGSLPVPVVIAFQQFAAAGSLLLWEWNSGASFMILSSSSGLAGTTGYQVSWFAVG